MKNVMFLFGFALLLMTGCKDADTNDNGKAEPEVMKAVIGDGTSMHNLMLVNGDDTLCLVMDDSTVCNTDLVVGKTVIVTICERDGALAAATVNEAK